MAVRGPLALPERIFQALTEPAGLQGWLSQDVEAQPVAGSTAVFHFDQRVNAIRVEIMELVPSSKLVWKVLQGMPAWEHMVSTITWELMRSESGTFVNFVQDGWESTAGAFSSVNFKWAWLMTSLKNYIEAGHGTPLP